LAEGLRTEPHASFAVLREGGVTKSRTSRSTTGVPASTPPRWNCIFKGREVAQSCESHSCMISSCTNSYFFSPLPRRRSARSLLASDVRLCPQNSNYTAFPPLPSRFPNDRPRSRKRGTRRNSARESSSRTRVSRRRRAGRPIEQERSPICRLSGRGERRVGNSADRKSVVRSVQEGGGRGFRKTRGEGAARSPRRCRCRCQRDAQHVRALSVSHDVPSIAVSLSLSLSLLLFWRAKEGTVRSIASSSARRGGRRSPAARPGPRAAASI